jgi:hypothetical protein
VILKKRLSGSPLFLLYQFSDILGVMDDMGQISSLVKDRKVNGIPVSLLELSASF